MVLEYCLVYTLRSVWHPHILFTDICRKPPPSAPALCLINSALALYNRLGGFSHAHRLVDGRLWGAADWRNHRRHLTGDSPGLNAMPNRKSAPKTQKYPTLCLSAIDNLAANW